MQKKLLPVVQLLREGQEKKAKEVFENLAIVDTPEHLSQPKEIRHLIWDMYEYLVLSNSDYSSKNAIIADFTNIFIE